MRFMETKRKRRIWPVTLAVFLLIAAMVIVSLQKKIVEEKHIVFVVKTIDDSTGFWTSMINGANMAAKEYGVKLDVVGTESEMEYEKQGELIREAIRKKPKAIVLAPSSYTDTAVYAKEIEEAGIEMVLVDSVMEETMGSCVVATDNVEAGRKMGSFIKEYIQEELCIGVVGHVKGSSTATEREQGLREGLGELEQKIVDVVYCDSDYEKAYEVTKGLLERHPQINTIVGLNEYSSVGAAKAVSEMGACIHMIGFDNSLKEVEYLESGIFNAIVVQKPLNMGYLAVENTVKILQKREIPQYIDSGSALITKETMYSPENQKLLFPVQ